MFYFFLYKSKIMSFYMNEKGGKFTIEIKITFLNYTMSTNNRFMNFAH